MQKLHLALATSAALILAACGGSTSSSSTASRPVTATNPTPTTQPSKQTPPTPQAARESFAQSAAATPNVTAEQAQAAYASLSTASVDTSNLDSLKASLTKHEADSFSSLAYFDALVDQDQANTITDSQLFQDELKAKGITKVSDDFGDGGTGVRTFHSLNAAQASDASASNSGSSRGLTEHASTDSTHATTASVQQELGYGYTGYDIPEFRDPTAPFHFSTSNQTFLASTGKGVRVALVESDFGERSAASSRDGLTGVDRTKLNANSLVSFELNEGATATSVPNRFADTLTAAAKLPTALGTGEQKVTSGLAFQAVYQGYDLNDGTANTAVYKHLASIAAAASAASATSSTQAQTTPTDIVALRVNDVALSGQELVEAAKALTDADYAKAHKDDSYVASLAAGLAELGALGAKAPLVVVELPTGNPEQTVSATDLVGLLTTSRYADNLLFVTTSGKQYDQLLKGCGVTAPICLDVKAGDNHNSALGSVVSVAALVKQNYPWMTAKQVRDTVLTTTNQEGKFNSVTGWQTPNAERAVYGPRAILGDTTWNLPAPTLNLRNAYEEAVFYQLPRQRVQAGASREPEFHYGKAEPQNLVLSGHVNFLHNLGGEGKLTIVGTRDNSGEGSQARNLNTVNFAGFVTPSKGLEVRDVNVNFVPDYNGQALFTHPQVTMASYFTSTKGLFRDKVRDTIFSLLSQKYGGKIQGHGYEEFPTFVATALKEPLSKLPASSLFTNGASDLTLGANSQALISGGKFARVGVEAGAKLTLTPALFDRESVRVRFWSTSRPTSVNSLSLASGATLELAKTNNVKAVAAQNLFLVPYFIKEIIDVTSQVNGNHLENYTPEQLAKLDAVFRGSEKYSNLPEPILVLEDLEMPTQPAEHVGYRPSSTAYAARLQDQVFKPLVLDRYTKYLEVLKTTKPELLKEYETFRDETYAQVLERAKQRVEEEKKYRAKQKAELQAQQQAENARNQSADQTQNQPEKTAEEQAFAQTEQLLAQQASTWVDPSQSHPQDLDRVLKSLLNKYVPDNAEAFITDLSQPYAFSVDTHRQLLTKAKEQGDFSALNAQEFLTLYFGYEQSPMVANLQAGGNLVFSRLDLERRGPTPLLGYGTFTGNFNNVYFKGSPYGEKSVVLDRDDSLGLLYARAIDSQQPDQNHSADQDDSTQGVDQTQGSDQANQGTDQNQGTATENTQPVSRSLAQLAAQANPITPVQAQGLRTASLVSRGVDALEQNVPEGYSRVYFREDLENRTHDAVATDVALLSSGAGLADALLSSDLEVAQAADPNQSGSSTSTATTNNVVLSDKLTKDDNPVRTLAGETKPTGVTVNTVTEGTNGAAPTVTPTTFSLNDKDVYLQARKAVADYSDLELGTFLYRASAAAYSASHLAVSQQTRVLNSDFLVQAGQFKQAVSAADLADAASGAAASGLKLNTYAQYAFKRADWTQEASQVVGKWNHHNFAVGVYGQLDLNQAVNASSSSAGSLGSTAGNLGAVNLGLAATHLTGTWLEALDAKFDKSVLSENQVSSTSLVATAGYAWNKAFLNLGAAYSYQGFNSQRTLFTERDLTAEYARHEAALSALAGAQLVGDQLVGLQARAGVTATYSYQGEFAEKLNSEPKATDAAKALALTAKSASAWELVGNLGVVGTYKFVTNGLTQGLDASVDVSLRALNADYAVKGETLVNKAAKTEFTSGATFKPTYLVRAQAGYSYEFVPGLNVRVGAGYSKTTNWGAFEGDIKLTYSF